MRVDESVFGITDGTNFYRLTWDADEEEAIITHHKNPKTIKEEFNKMNHLWGYSSNKSTNVRTNLKEDSNKVFKDMLNKVRK